MRIGEGWCSLNRHIGQRNIHVATAVEMAGVAPVYRVSAGQGGQTIGGYTVVILGS